MEFFKGQKWQQNIDLSNIRFLKLHQLAEINLNCAEVSVYFVIYIYPVTVIKCRRILCTWINKRGLFELLSLCSRPINAAISTLCHTIPFRPVVYGKVRTSCSSIEHLPSFVKPGHLNDLSFSLFFIHAEIDNISIRYIVEQLDEIHK